MYWKVRSCPIASLTSAHQFVCDRRQGGHITSHADYARGFCATILANNARLARRRPLSTFAKFAGSVPSLLARARSQCVPTQSARCSRAANEMNGQNVTQYLHRLINHDCPAA